MIGLVAPPISAPRIKLAIRSLLHTTPPPTKKLPATFDILIKMIGLLQGFDKVFWSAVFSLAFYGALRGAEYAIQFCAGIGWSRPLLVSDLESFYSCQLPAIKLNIPRTKTLAHGRKIILGCSGHTFCAPCCILSYFQLRRGPAPSAPLFISQNGLPLTKLELNKKIKALAIALNLEASKFSSHSIRAGSATSGSKAGLSDLEIQELGGWSSDAYKGYIRRDELHSVTYARRLTTTKN